MTITSEALRIGVAGVGSLGFHHTRIARDLPGVRMMGFHEPRPERTREVEEQLGVPGFAALGDLLDQVDALIISTPTTTHRDVAVAALERGIHVFIEKPIAPSLDEADEILEAAERGGALVQVGHVERFNTAVVAARPYLDRPVFIESHRLAPFTVRGTDVAVVLDLMIHDVDLVGSLVGAPVSEIHATGVPVLTPSVDIANARIQYETGAVANLTASRVSAERMRKLRIFQRSGYLSLDLAAGTGEFLRLRADLPALAPPAAAAGGEFGSEAAHARSGVTGTDAPLAPDLWSLVERIPLHAPEEEPLRREQESFVHAISRGVTPEVTGREGRTALEVALAIESRILSHVADSRPKS
ncbi:MAG: gfo/Idh/MocA family oxidoreductase [Gemmatimonadales bacterium]|nr:MAG: gfo/Idh/MocA family oxidoreductase [Gemmatimonadales bacterium]